MSITREQMLAIGGKPWTSSDGTKTRIYLNLSDEDWERLVGLSIDRYNTGNIAMASWGGRRISNSRAARMVDGKIWWEDDGTLHLDVHGDIKADLYAALVAWLEKAS